MSYLAHRRKAFRQPQGFYFNGTSTKGEKSISSYRGSDTLGTVTYWFKTTSDKGVVLGAGDDATAVHLVIFTIAGPAGSGGEVAIELMAGSGTYQRKETTATYNDGEWHHVAIASDGSTITFYIDGSSVGSTVDGGTPDNDWWDYTSLNDNLTIGVLKNNGTYVSYYEGWLRDIAVYDAELSSGTIAADYAAGVPSATNRVNWWKLDEKSGDSTFVDSEGTDDLTITA